MRKTKLIAVFMAALVLVYTSCSEKEVTKPVEDSARVDALRKELFELQRLIFGTDGGEEGLATTNAMLSLENKDLEEQIKIIQAEIDRLRDAYNKGIPYQVVVTDFQGVAIAGASVTINENGAIVTRTTDAEGKVNFEKVRAGAIVGVVSATGFATANYGTSLYLAEAGVNTRIALLPKSGILADASMFTVKGYLYADLNTADDTLTGFRYGNQNGTMFVGSTPSKRLPKGPNVDFPHRSFDKQNKKLSVTIDMHKYYIPYSDYYNSNPGAIQFIAYENVKWDAVIDANNQYTVKLPVSTYFETEIIDFSFKFSGEEFIATKTMVDDGASAVWNDTFQYDYGFGFLPEMSVFAYPAPKTFTQTRTYRLGGVQFKNDFVGWVTWDDFYFDTDDFGTSSLGAIAGQTYELDFYYYDFRN
jgi:hypothetical protein